MPRITKAKRLGTWRKLMATNRWRADYGSDMFRSAKPHSWSFRERERKDVEQTRRERYQVSNWEILVVEIAFTDRSVNDLKKWTFLEAMVDSGGPSPGRGNRPKRRDHWPAHAFGPKWQKCLQMETFWKTLGPNQVYIRKSAGRRGSGLLPVVQPQPPANYPRRGVTTLR
jgi:hypothetical protein